MDDNGNATRITAPTIIRKIELFHDFWGTDKIVISDETMGHQWCKDDIAVLVGQREDGKKL